MRRKTKINFLYFSTIIFGGFALSVLVITYKYHQIIEKHNQNAKVLSFHLESDLKRGVPIESAGITLKTHSALRKQDKGNTFHDHTSILLINDVGKIIYSSIVLWKGSNINDSILKIEQHKNSNFEKIKNCTLQSNCDTQELDTFTFLERYNTYSRSFKPNTLVGQKIISQQMRFLYTYSLDDFYNSIGDDWLKYYLFSSFLVAIINLPAYLYVILDFLPSLVLALQTDGLTKLMDRRLFTDQCNKRLTEGQDTKSELVLCIIDIDDFKKVNDTYGHLEGDNVIAKIGEIILKNNRNGEDISSRYGGEEFAILYQTSPENCALSVNRIRHQIELLSFHHNNNIKITISAGLASTSKHGYNLDVLMSKADINLYKSKALGKNRVTGDH